MCTKAQANIKVCIQKRKIYPITSKGSFLPDGKLLPRQLLLFKLILLLLDFVQRFQFLHLLGPLLFLLYNFRDFSEFLNLVERIVVGGAGGLPLAPLPAQLSQARSLHRYVIIIKKSFYLTLFITERYFHINLVVNTSIRKD